MVAPPAEKSARSKPPIVSSPSTRTGASALSSVRPLGALARERDDLVGLQPATAQDLEHDRADRSGGTDERDFMS
jgi:hypothetical protein